MNDFKPHYDRVLSAQAEVQNVLNEIDAAMKLGTPEGEAQALALESKLDEAIAKRDQAQGFYDKVVSAHKASDVALNFVPVSATSATPLEEKPKGNMTIAEYRKLSPKERLSFAKAGGILEEGEQK